MSKHAAPALISDQTRREVTAHLSRALYIAALSLVTIALAILSTLVGGATVAYVLVVVLACVALYKGIIALLKLTGVLV